MLRVTSDYKRLLSEKGALDLKTLHQYYRFKKGKTEFLDKNSHDLYILEKFYDYSKFQYDKVSIETAGKFGDKIYEKLDLIFSKIFQQHFDKSEPVVVYRKETGKSPPKTDLNDLNNSTDIIWYSIDGNYFVYQLEGPWDDYDWYEDEEYHNSAFFTGEVRFEIKNNKIVNTKKYEHEKNKGVCLMVSSYGELDRRDHPFLDIIK